MASGPRCGFRRLPHSRVDATAGSARFREEAARSVRASARRLAKIFDRRVGQPDSRLTDRSKPADAIASRPMCWPKSERRAGEEAARSVREPPDVSAPMGACVQMHWLGCGCAFGFALILSLCAPPSVWRRKNDKHISSLRKVKNLENFSSRSKKRQSHFVS